MATWLRQGNSHNHLPSVMGVDSRGVWLCVGGRLEAEIGKFEYLYTCIYMDAGMVEVEIGK